MKSYSEDTLADAAEILGDCLHDGHSDGWSGAIEQKEELERVLTPFNVRYVDDMRGTWKRVDTAS